MRPHALSTVAVLLVGTLIVSATQRSPKSANPDGPWRQFANPEDAGWSAPALAAARTFAEQQQSGAVLVVDHGAVVVAWGDIERRFKSASVRKSIVSALYGIESGRGSLRLDATLEQLGIDDREPLTPAERQARVADLLRARSGVYHPAARETAQMRQRRPARGSHAPGTHFFYNNWDFNVLAEIFRRQVGRSIFAEFHEHLAKPLGMEDVRPNDMYFQLEPSLSRYPAYEFRISARDLARIGVLYLQEGRWNGRDIIPAAWIRESLRAHTSLDDRAGYGYLWWINPGTYQAPEVKFHHLATITHYAALGLGGQFMLMIPDREVVIVHRGDTDNGMDVHDGTVFELAEMLVSAKTGARRAGAAATDVRSLPFAHARPAPPERRAMQVDPATYDAFVGSYDVKPGVVARIFKYEGRLFVDMPGRGEAELFPSGRDEFFLKVVDAVIRFTRDDRDTVTGVTVEERGKPMTGRKIG